MSFRFRGLVFSFVLIGVFAIASYAQSAGSAPIYEVKFVKGVYVKTGAVQPTHPCPQSGPTDCGSGNSTRLTIKATKGERVRFRLTSESGGAVFSIGSEDGYPLKDAASVTAWTGTFPADGDFRITVYTSKSSTRYVLKISKL